MLLPQTPPPTDARHKQDPPTKHERSLSDTFELDALTVQELVEKLGVKERHAEKIQRACAANKEPAPVETKAQKQQRPSNKGGNQNADSPSNLPPKWIKALLRMRQKQLEALKIQHQRHIRQVRQEHLQQWLHEMKQWRQALDTQRYHERRRDRLPLKLQKKQYICGD